MSTVHTSVWTLWCDGGSRGNPGPGAGAYVLQGPDGREVEAKGEWLGEVTNNVAEYRALLAGLEAAVRHGVKRLDVRLDTELVARQMTGEYRVKHEGLKPLHASARQLVSRLDEVRFSSIPREANARADQIVNETLDRVLDSESSR